MNKNFYFLIMIVSFFLASCDPFYGPKFRNEYPHDVRVSVEYENGQKQFIMWPACRSIFLGKPDQKIYKITIEFEDVVVQKFAKSDIDKFLAEQNNNPDIIWAFNQDGIKLASNNKCLL